jgi:DinB superfamily
MKDKILIRSFVALVLTFAIAATAMEVTEAEQERALTYLESTKVNLLATTKGLSAAQWNFKPAPDRWSIAQVMEHIAASEDFIRDGLIKEKVMVSVPGPPDRDVKKIDNAVVMMVPDRSHKAQAPDALVPNNRFGSPEGSLRHFTESRVVTEQYLETVPGLRDHVMDGPVGKMDGYEFILFIAAHSERHTKQIEEVKADPNFPKS